MKLRLLLIFEKTTPKQTTNYTIAPISNLIFMTAPHLLEKT